MKCREPGSNREAEVKVFAGGVECTEYAVPRSGTPKNTSGCCVAIKDHQTVTLKFQFSGDAVCGEADLLVQGVFRNDFRFGKRMPKSTEESAEKPICNKQDLKKEDVETDDVDVKINKEDAGKESARKDAAKIKCWARKGDFAYAVLKRKDTLEPRAISVRRLASSGLGRSNRSGSSCGIGAVSVIFSIQTSLDETTAHSHDYLTIDDEEKGTPLSAQQKTIPGHPPPTHEIILAQKPLLPKEVTKSKLESFRAAGRPQRNTGLRYGHKAWARFDIYLRSKEEIAKAGLIPLGGAHVLHPLKVIQKQSAPVQPAVKGIKREASSGTPRPSKSQKLQPSELSMLERFTQMKQHDDHDDDEELQLAKGLDQKRLLESGSSVNPIEIPLTPPQVRIEAVVPSVEDLDQLRARVLAQEKEHAARKSQHQATKLHLDAIRKKAEEAERKALEKRSLEVATNIAEIERQQREDQREIRKFHDKIKAANEYAE